MKKITKAFDGLTKSKLILPIIAGSSLALTVAPFYLFPFGFLSLCYLFYIIERSKTFKQSFFLGLSYGFGFFLAGTYWITISLFSDLKNFWYLVPFSITLIPLFLGTYIALATLSYKILVNKLKFERTYKKIIIFAILWLLFEVLRSTLFSGFPWNLIGYSWLFNINAAQIGNIFGIYGLSLLATLIFLSPIFFIDLSHKKFKLLKLPQIRKIDKGALALLVLIPIMAATYGNTFIIKNKIDQDQEEKIRIVQGNIPQDLKWDENQRYLNLIKYLHLTTSKPMNSVKTVIWPETAIPYAIKNNEYKAYETIKVAIPEGGQLITGAVRLQVEENNQYKVWNSLFVFNQNGQLAKYDKRHLVPFGEYVPLSNYIPFIKKITEGTTDFSAGKSIKTIPTSHFSFSPLICYEIIFSDNAINQYSRPDYLVNITNDAWFGNSTGPYQHLSMAQMRSIEYGIPTIRAANTGISALIDPFGRIVKDIKLNQEGVIDVGLIRSLRPTLYSRHKHNALLLSLSLLISVLLIKRK